MGILDYRTAFLFLFVFFSSTLFLIPACMRIAPLLSLVDDPVKSGRKIHSESVPYLGGVGIYISFVLGVGIFYGFFFKGEHDIIFLQWLIVYLIGGFFVLIVGTTDDIYDMPAMRKLYLQIAISVLIYFGGIQLNCIILPFVGIVEFGQFSFFITVFIVVATMNAINLIDGMDGLAGGVVLVAITANAFLALYQGLNHIFILSVVLGAALLGFLRHNWQPAKIFLGDGGSMLIGYLVAVLAIQNIQAAEKFSEVIVPVLALIYPVLDVWFAMFRRILRGKPMMSSDRAHIHHQFLQIGCNHSETSIIIILFAFVVSLSGVMFTYDLFFTGIITLALSFLMFLMCLFLMDYFNLGKMRHILKLRPTYKMYNAYKRFSQIRMQSATTVDDLWKTLIDVARVYKICRLEFVFGDDVKKWMADDNKSTSTEKQSFYMSKSGGEVKFIQPTLEDVYLRSEVGFLFGSLVNVMDNVIIRLQKLSGTCVKRNKRQ